MYPFYIAPERRRKERVCASSRHVKDYKPCVSTAFWGELKMAGKKYDIQVAQGKPKFAMVIAAVTLLGAMGTVAWFYSRPDAWLFTENSIEVNTVVTELRKTLVTLEAELEMIRKDSCARPKAGPYGSVKTSSLNPLTIPEEAVNPALAKQLRKLAINKEIIVVFANQNVVGMLKLLVQSVQRTGIRNYLVVALDKETANFCEEHHAPVYKRFDLINPESHSQNFAGLVSNFKFHVLRDFLVLGYSVLLSDVDIIYLQNPFNHLYRDSDVEGMTDGHSNTTSYGYIDSWDDPPLGRCRLVHSTRLWVFNSGLFYLRPTAAAIELLDRVYRRVSADASLWDQDVYNEEMMYPSRPGYHGLHISKRVMDYLLFMNSKTLFSIVRKDEKYANFRPVTVHVNYHSKKYERMQAAMEYYVHGKKDALAPFADGDP